MVRMEVKAGSNADNKRGNSTVWTISIPSRNSIAAWSATLMSGPNRRCLTGSQLIVPEGCVGPSLGGVRGLVVAGVGITGVGVGMISGYVRRMNFIFMVVALISCEAAMSYWCRSQQMG